MSVSQFMGPTLILYISSASNVGHRDPPKKAKKSKMGLHDNWVKRMHINHEDDMNDRQT